jgi:hypothetical protein
MNRIVSVVVAIAVVLVLPSSARADHWVESVTGGLRLEVTVAPDPPETILITGHLTVSARDASSGARGSVHFSMTGEEDDIRFVTEFDGEVECLQVTGDAAVLSGQITRSSGISPYDDKFQVTVVDGGNPQGGMTTDFAEVSNYAEIEGFPSPTIDPTTCLVSGPLAAFFVPAAESGNIIVHDDV